MLESFTDIDSPVIMHPPYNETGAYLGQTLRLGGVSANGYASFNLASHVGDNLEAIDTNWNRLSSATETIWNRKTIATCDQVHGDNILRVTEGGHQPTAADALICTVQGIGIGIFTADCVPVIFIDHKTKAVGAAHCGWRGAKSKLATKTLAQLLEAKGGNIDDVFVWLAASIAQCNYEVGPEVATCFGESHHQRGKNDRRLLDVAGAVEAELLAAGIRKHNLVRNRRDTFSEPDLFFSYRRDGAKTGRMLTFVGFPVSN